MSRFEPMPSSEFLPMFRALWIAAALVSAAPALAVVIDAGDGSGNDAPPGDDFGFENVGITSTNKGGVYLGGGWVITANHVKDQPITLLGSTYSPVPGSGVRLENVSPPKPDLYVYRIDGFPNLPSPVLSSATPSIGEEVSCVGNSWNRGATTTNWNSSWLETPPTVFTGYEKGTGRERRWGRNKVAEVGDLDVGDPPTSTTRGFITVFDQFAGSTHELQAVSGDSGGGCFAKRGNTWEFVGVMFAMSALQNQPPATAVFGNESLVADVFFYRDQIEALTRPPIGAVLAISLWGGAVLVFALIAVACVLSRLRR
jgi:hypothetical protein